MRALRFVDPVVHATRVCGQGYLRHIVRLGPFKLSSSKEAQLQLEPVAVERRLADHLRQPALALPAHQVHLEQPETRVHVTNGQEQVGVRLRDNMRGAVFLEHDANRLLEARDREGLTRDRRRASAATVQAPVVRLNVVPSAGSGPAPTKEA